MVKLNATVYSEKHGKGIIKEIITKSTGYVLVAYDKGYDKKEMAFNLTDESGKPLRKAPKARAPREFTPTPMQTATGWVMSVNGLIRGDRNSLSFQLWEERVDRIAAAATAAGNAFIASVCATVLRYARVSDKQAWCLARFAVENGVSMD